MLSKIGQLAREIRIGYTIRKLKPGAKAPDPASLYRVPVLQAKDVDHESVALRSAELMELEIPTDPAPYMPDPGDLIFLARGHRHWALPVDESMPHFLAPSYFFILRADPSRVRSAYLAWYINREATQDFLRSVAKGSNIPFISKADLADVSVPSPDLATQEKIAELAALGRREESLLHHLAERRRVLLDTVCLKLAENGDQR